MKIILIEDEVQARESLKKMLNLVNPETEVLFESGHITNSIEFLKTNTVDLVFLDLHLEDGTGFDLLNSFPNRSFKVIITTAYDDKAVEAYRSNAALWNSQHSPLNFASERFSKFGEVFCYLKMDGSKDTSQEKFEDKSDIEDALDDILIKEKIGCFIGGGSGYRYSYIDLVLTDVEKVIQLIRETLQKGNISKSTWIMFYDEELAYEWVGIWDDSPKPKLIRL